ncbi:hypothetical protein GCM10023083_84060 [Streptomyces phyllanthi]
MRVLAVAPSRVWIAVSGTLSATTRHRLHQVLRAGTGQGNRELFLDLRELRCAEGVAAEDVRSVFALGPAVRLHLIGAPTAVHDRVTGQARVTLHPDLESAWRAWS